MPTSDFREGIVASSRHLEMPRTGSQVAEKQQLNQPRRGAM
jgi:hypothetical protein